MTMLLITYAGDDIRVAEALRTVLAVAGLHVCVDRYAKPGRQPADTDPRYGLAKDAGALLLINPRPDSDDTQPREAIRALREKHAAAARGADSASAAPAPTTTEVFLCLVNNVAADAELLTDLRTAEAAGAVRLRTLVASLRLPYQHWPATFESMSAVRAEVCAALAIDPPAEESRFSWKRLRYGPYSRFAVLSAPAAAGVLGLLGVLANVNDSGDLAGKMWRFVSGAEAEVGPGVPSEASPPVLLARYISERSLPINIAPTNKPPAVGMKAEATAQNPCPGRAIYVLSVQPGFGVHVDPVSEGGRDDHRRRLEFVLDNAGPHTLMVVAVPLGGPSPEQIRDAAAAALEAHAPVLAPGVWLRWNADNYEWHLPDGSKGAPIPGEALPPEDRWAMALRDAVLSAGGEGTLFHGWSFNVVEPKGGAGPEERGSLAGGGA